MDTPDLPTSLVADRYKLVRRVGTGNMSTVYEGMDTHRNTLIVAVKLLNTPHDDELKREIFRRETKALATLEHMNIVKVFDQRLESLESISKKHFGRFYHNMFVSYNKL